MKRLFTLIELLVVIAIIGILSSMLLPALSDARSHTKFAVCKNNQKQIGIALISYADSNNEYLPNGSWNGGMARQSSWEIRLGSFMGIDYSADFLASNGEIAPINNASLLCPEDDNISPTQGFARSYQVNGYQSWSNLASNYGVFGNVSSRTISQIKTKTVILMDAHAENSDKHQGCSWFSAIAGDGNFDELFSFHLKSRYNFLYEDGHVATNKKNDLMLNNKALLQAIE
jgi:prepilin-type N-terminal cleavage/methylation domain-containing protein